MTDDRPEELSGNQVEHLKMIQTVIERMGRNSFMLKGWAVTLVAAAIFLMARSDGSDAGRLMIVPFLVSIAFWFLDAYYLDQEARFRQLYDDVRTGADTDPFSMRTREYEKRGYLGTVISKTEIWFYAPLLATSLVVAWILGA